MERAAIARHLEEIALLLSLKGENPFAVRAFENAAHTVADLPDLPQRLAEGRLQDVPGIGKAIRQVLEDLATTGRSRAMDGLRAELPPGLPELVKVPGLGPKRIAALWKEQGITSLDELENAIRDGALKGAQGFGPKTTTKLMEGLAFVRATAGRFLLPKALEHAERVREAFLASADAARAGVTRVELAADLRRGMESACGIVLAVACERPRDLSPFREELGVPPVSLVASRPEAFGTAWLLATGSSSHLALLNERDGGAALTRPAASEEEIYERLGLPFIPPELREGKDELELAASGALPELIGAGDLGGAFHVHSTYSDGKATLREVLQRAVELGWSFVGISDHSPAAAYANGLTPERVDKQWAELDALRAEFPSLTVFRGTEADILTDGSIDYGDEFLSRFDFVIASVHSSLQLDSARQTERLIRAVRNPRVTLLGHATSRLLLERNGFEVDMPAVLAAAGEAGCGVESNGAPRRMELDWRLGAVARRHGVFTSANPDAHDLPALSHVRWAATVARKAGFRRADVLNAGDAASVGRRLAELKSRR